MKNNQDRNENLELFKQALSEAISNKFDKMAKEAEDIELPEPSRRHKLEMNRILREATDGAFIPYPEIDG